jgi:hypothetical protein
VRGFKVSRDPKFVEKLQDIGGFRRIFSHFDKLDLMFIAFIYFALIIEALR